MSYQISNYNQSTRNPFGGPAKTVPFPGWGILPYAAGPARIGVGSPDGLGLTVPTGIKTSAMQPRPMAIVASQADTTGVPGGGGGAVEPGSAPSSGWPWWIWLAAPLALGGAGLFAYDYFMSKPRAKPNARRRRRVIMSKQEAVREFYRIHLPGVQILFRTPDGRVDEDAAWQNYKEVLRRDGLITDAQYFQWTNPPEKRP